jgi:type I restriction enzyme S subunit
LRGTLGKYALVDESVPAGAIASSLIIIRPLQNKLSVRFLYYYLQSRHCTNMIELWAGGAAQPNLGGQDLARFSMFLPTDVDAQLEIAETLSTLDDEIEGLQAKLEKARKIKQGMMQELLTGRVRLV